MKRAKPAKVQFFDRREVRMGAPFNVCRVQLSGKWVPSLPENGEGFQDQHAWSPEGKQLALVRWGLSDDPGFYILIVSFTRKRVTRLGRIKGCCAGLMWDNGGLAYTAWRRVTTKN
jgi:hypothetical protein